jgi:hypothetical protein
LIDKTSLRSAQRHPNNSCSLSQSCIPSRLHGLFGLIVIFSSPIVFTLLSRSLIHNERQVRGPASLKMGDDFGVAGFALVLRLYHQFLWIGAWIQYHCGRPDK